MPINPYIKPPKKDNNDWSKALNILGLVGGGAAGALLAKPPENQAGESGSTAGADPREVTTGQRILAGFGGAAQGMGMASAFQPLIPDKSKPAEASPTIENDAMSRRMSVLQNNLNEDPYHNLREAALALPNLNAAERAAAGEPILRALQMGARGQRA